MAAIKQSEYFPGERSEATQIHLVMPKNSRKRLSGPAAKIVKIHLRNQRRVNVIVPRPFEHTVLAAEDVPFKFFETHRSKARPPKLACGMQQIKVQLGCAGQNSARHAVARFEQRPVETFSVEGYEHGALGHSLGQFEQKRMLLIEIAHKELLDLQSAGIPPREAHKECIR